MFLESWMDRCILEIVERVVVCYSLHGIDKTSSPMAWLCFDRRVHLI